MNAMFSELERDLQPREAMSKKIERGNAERRRSKRPEIAFGPGAGMGGFHVC
jgi:hypothetical protein